MFVSYTAPVLPLFVVALFLVLQDVLGRPGASRVRRQVGLGVVAVYVGVVAATFVYFHPVIVGEPLSHAEWLDRMWSPSWF